MTKKKSFFAVFAICAIIGFFAPLTLETAYAETPEERCKRETQAYNDAWERSWEQSHPKKVAKGESAPPPPVPYRCVAVPSETPAPLPPAPSGPGIPGATNPPIGGSGSDIDPVTGLPKNVPPLKQKRSPGHSGYKAGRPPHGTPGMSGYNPNNPWVDSGREGKSDNSYSEPDDTLSDSTNRINDGNKDLPLQLTEDKNNKALNKRQSSPFVPPNELDRDGKPSKTFREKAHPSPKEFLERFNPFTNKSDTNSELNRSKQASSEEDSEQKKSQQSSTKRVPFDSPAEPISILVAIAGLLTGTRKRSIAINHAYSEVYGPYPPGEKTSYRDYYSADDVKKIAIDYEHTVKPSKLAVGDSRTLCFTDGKEVVAKRVAKDTYMVIVYDPDRNVLFKTWQWRDGKGNVKRMEVNAVSGEKTVWRKGPKFDGYPAKEKYGVNVSTDGKTSRKEPAVPPPPPQAYGPYTSGEQDLRNYPANPSSIKGANDQFEDEVNPWTLAIGDSRSKCFTDGRIVTATRVGEYTYNVVQRAPDGRVLYKTVQWQDRNGNSERTEVNAVSEEKMVWREGPKFDDYPSHEKYGVNVSTDGKTSRKQSRPAKHDSDKQKVDLDSALGTVGEGATSGEEEAAKQFIKSEYFKYLSPAAKRMLKAIPAVTAALLVAETAENVSNMMSQGIPFNDAMEIESRCVVIILSAEGAAGLATSASGPATAIAAATLAGMAGYWAADQYRDYAIKKYLRNNPQKVTN